MMQNSKSSGRSWLYGGMFVCALGAVVGFAAYSSKPVPQAQASTTDEKTEPVMPTQELAQPAVTTPKKSGNGKEIVWEESFEAAMTRARLEKKPILVDFYTDWCSACKSFEKEVLPQKAVIAESANWVTVRINGEKRPDVAQAYGVTGYPTFIFAHNTGRPINILPGYAPDIDFARLMRDSRAKFEKQVS